MGTTTCAGSGQSASNLTHVGGGDAVIGKCAECGHMTECNSEGVAYAHERDAGLTLF